MMAPPPALRICGVAYLHMMNAPVRFTRMAFSHNSSESVSALPSGVTAAATLTSVVSEPNVSMVFSTAAFALSSKRTSI